MRTNNTSCQITFIFLVDLSGDLLLKAWPLFVNPINARCNRSSRSAHWFLDCRFYRFGLTVCGNFSPTRHRIPTGDPGCKKHGLTNPVLPTANCPIHSNVAIGARPIRPCTVAFIAWQRWPGPRHVTGTRQNRRAMFTVESLLPTSRLARLALAHLLRGNRSRILRSHLGKAEKCCLSEEPSTIQEASNYDHRWHELPCD
jgi:hypothetical protein